MSGQPAGGEVLVTTLDQIPLGEGRTFHLAGGEIAIFRPHDGGIYVTQAYCPHLGGPLADGLTGGTAANPVHHRVPFARPGLRPRFWLRPDPRKVGNQGFPLSPR